MAICVNCNRTFVEEYPEQEYCSVCSPGDFMVIYQPHPAGPHLPDRVIGDAVVLITDRTTSIAKIVYARNVVHRGDAIALR